jgi:hypothetical protein
MVIKKQRRQRFCFHLLLYNSGKYLIV